MAACSRSSGSDQPSIKYMWTKPGAASFELSDFDQEGNVSKLSGSYRQHSKLSEPKTSEILSTAEFVSAVGRLWNWANRPLSVFQPKTNAKYTDYGYQKQNMLCYSGAEANGKASISADTKCFCTDVMDDSYFPQVVNSEFECLKVTQKISLFDPCNGHRSHLSFGRYLQTSDSQLPVESWKGKGLISVGISYNLGEIYGWIRQIPFLGPKSSVNAIHSKNNKEDQGCISGGTITPVGIFTRESSDYSTCVTKREDSLLVENAASEHHAQMPVNSLYSDYHFDLVSNIEANSVVPRTSSSNLYLDYHTDLPSLSNCIFEECKHTSDDEEMLKNGKRQVKELVLEHGHTTELRSSVQNKSGFALGKKRHAFAGALAGTCVSLCLHPVDTVKTVIQSRYMYEKSIGHIVRSIISERGVTGFYRGIASNIACSAPISAVYTFTYESVKGALLPILSKEYYSIAHCTAGGCASIATSFIFTPSERIKQQMQIGSHYQSCWCELSVLLFDNLIDIKLSSSSLAVYLVSNLYITTFIEWNDAIMPFYLLR
uniref:Uncharacterized protein n=1 Tax=Nelumbo nucifera TaxID=4432 RepID=A0A822ZR76_NELNU|nr:TPA_asm: hypothetical protein HUJ06_017310 [Nelumbo nucifera]